MKFFLPIMVGIFLLSSRLAVGDEGAATCQVQVSRLNVRGAPSMRARVLWDLRGGSFVTTTGGCGRAGWTAILSTRGKRIGYVAARTLKEIEEEEDLPESMSAAELRYHLTTMRLRIADLERRVDEAEMRLDRAARRY